MPVLRAAPLDDLPDGQAVRVVVGGFAVCLTSLDGRPHAISDVCPHNGASLSDGVIRDDCITCPAHLWRFSMLTGEKQGTPEVQVQVYPTRVTDDGWVEVEVPDPAPVRSLRETLLAHARGEDLG